MSRRDLGRLARRIAAGDLQAALRAVAILEAGGDEGVVPPLVARVEAAFDATGGDPSGAIRSALFEFFDGIALSGRIGGSRTDPMKPLWIVDFGLAWRVPWQILALVDRGEARDTSWLNDVCPSFSREFETGHRLVLWSNHPDPAERETGTRPRFAVDWVTPDDEWPWAIMETEDVDEAVQAFRQAAGDMEAGREPPRFSR